ncbi:RimK family alpha-L-glutamate ligase [Candidatus Woesearchaeota archaeon]|nr:RimK family alpha-L-glutamate ligase [Candidatus Woesearchaeota archaeon]
MKAALISLGSVSSKMTAQAMSKYFETVDMLDIRDLEVSLGGRKAEILYKGEPISEYDCIYAKGSFRFANLLRSITAMLCSSCYMPIDAEAFTSGHDKLLTHINLQRNNVPMPVTYVATTAEAAKTVLKKMTCPIIIKMPAGTHGKGVMVADSHESAASMIDALGMLKQPFLLQEFVQTGGTDVRALVVGDKVVASMKRTAIKGETRSNLHAGGSGSAIILDRKTQKVAIEAAKAMGVSICGVDILESVRGPMVLEINLSPGLQGITETTKVDIADKIAKFLYEETQKRKSAGIKEKSSRVVKEFLPAQEILAKLDLRGERILLPEFVTRLTQFDDEKEVKIKADKGKLEISED